MGYHLMEVYLAGTLRKWRFEPRLAPEWNRVARLEAKLATLKEKTKLALEQNYQDYYRAFAPAFRPGFWKVPLQWTQINTSFASQTSTNCQVMQLTDFCISTLLGTEKGSGQPCLVPDDCRRAVTNPYCSGYDLSHQLFFFLFAEMEGCSDPLFLNAQYYKNLFCASMMQININAEKQGLLEIFGDLFTENIMFCGMSGFSDLYKPQWLDLILSWQKPESGCFWMYGDKQLNNHDQIFNAHVLELRRAKRSEKFLDGGCSSHNTAVAVGVLAGFLYYGF